MQDQRQMQEQEQPPQPPRRGIGGTLFLRPREEASGAAFSAVVVGMLVISLLFSVAVVTVTQVTGATTEELAASDIYIYLSYLLYQVVFFGVTAWFLHTRRERLPAVGYRKAGWQYFLLAAALAFGMLFSLGWLNDRIVLLFEKLGYELPTGSIPTLTGFGIAGALLVIAVLPALLEETIFRGVILEGMKDLGTVAACLLGGMLFSIFHQSPAQTVYQFLCGVVFTLLALRANSVLPAILAHFLNNAFILLNARFGWLDGVTGGGAVALYAASAVCLVGALVYLIAFDRRTDRKKTARIRSMLFPAVPGIVLCAVLWFFNLFA